MAIYSYTALNQDGEAVKGKSSARNWQELEAKLKESGLDLVSSKQIKSGGLSFFSKASLEDLILICVHIYQLERAGVPILESIADLRDEASSPLVRNVMMDIYDALKSGKMLSAALAEHPKVFDSIFVSLVAAGEKTGSFAEIFGHLEQHLKWVFDIKNKIKRAVMYPAFLFLMLMGVITIMMVYVIPKLTSFLLSEHIPLPWYTKALIATSNFMVQYWYLVISMPFSIFLIIKGIRLASRVARYQIDGLILKIPYMGTILRKFEVSRFCHFFALTYRSGMGILECLETAGSVVQNAQIKESIESIKQAVADGQKITNALKASGEFPSLVIRMFKVGESSGNLDQPLQNVNRFYDQEVDQAVNTLVELLHPLLTIVMGGILGWITISVFGPVYSSFSKINGA